MRHKVQLTAAARACVLVPEELAEPIAKGREFRDLNPEQQAKLMEQAAKRGFFSSDEAVKTVRVIVDGVDYTDAVRTAQTKLRAGADAP